MLPGMHNDENIILAEVWYPVFGLIKVIAFYWSPASCIVTDVNAEEWIDGSIRKDTNAKLIHGTAHVPLTKAPLALRRTRTYSKLASFAECALVQSPSLILHLSLSDLL